MRKILKNVWFLNILKIIGILSCFYFWKASDLWVNIVLITCVSFILINHTPYRFKALSGNKKKIGEYFAKSPGLIAFFTTLLNLFKVNQDIVGDFKQAIIMGILIHLSTMSVSENNIKNNVNTDNRP